MQTVISLLNALETDDKWQAVTIEPNLDSTKVDILWEYPDKKRATQIKSSQNRIDKPEAERWAYELLQSKAADEYELILASYYSGGLIEGQLLGGVVIKLRDLDSDRLVMEGAQKLGVYLEDRSFPQVSSRARELIVRSLVTELQTYSTKAGKITRKELDDTLSLWLLPVLNAQVLSNIAIELKELAEFRALYGVEAKPDLRKAIKDFDNSSPNKNTRYWIKEALDFLRVKNGKLHVEIKKWEYFLYSFFFLWAILFMLLGALLIIPVWDVQSAKLYFVLTTMCLTLFGTSFLILNIVRPFLQALRIRKEIHRMQRELQ